MKMKMVKRLARGSDQTAANAAPNDASRAAATSAAADCVSGVLSFDVPERHDGQNQRKRGYRRGDGDQAAGRIRIEHMSANGGGHDESDDHHNPDDGRRGSAPMLVDTFCQENE